jgi:hypothetical protein
MYRAVFVMLDFPVSVAAMTLGGADGFTKMKPAVSAIYFSERLVASRSRSYRLVSGNGGSQDSRRTIQLS